MTTMERSRERGAGSCPAVEDVAQRRAEMSVGSSKEGFYSIAFQGIADWGIGVIVVDSGIVVGIDAGGVTYDGTYQFNPRTDKVDAKLTATISAGARIPQRLEPILTEHKIQIDVALPRDLGRELPVTVNTPYGPFALMIQKIRDFPS